MEYFKKGSVQTQDVSCMPQDLSVGRFGIIAQIRISNHFI